MSCLAKVALSILIESRCTRVRAVGENLQSAFARETCDMPKKAEETPILFVVAREVA